jgi:hypothetical protein
MAVVKGINQITGTIENVTYYTMHGSDKVFLRRKGGPTKYRIQTDSKYATLRLNNSEWKGCAFMTQCFRSQMPDIRPIEDYPVCGSLNAIFKKIQKKEPVANLGKRSILLSQNKDLLNGFSFSRKQALESILKVQIESSIDRERGQIQVNIPTINTRIQLYNFQKLPYFRIAVDLVAISDIIYSETESNFIREYDLNRSTKNWVKTEWFPTAGVVPAIQLNFQHPDYGPTLPDCETLILIVGVEFGKMDDNLIPQAVKYAGSAKVVKVG